LLSEHEELDALRAENERLKELYGAGMDSLNKTDAESERLQRENGSLARAYAACERLLRDRSEENERLRAALAFARSVIKSGEGWTRTCTEVIDGALGHS
jgi:hypothetical protein